MSGWLGQLVETASLRLGGRRAEQPPENQPFAVVCECGQEHEGIRRRRHLQIVCNECGAALFVLPASPYPPPPHRKPKRRGKPSRERLAEDRAVAEPGDRPDSLSDSVLEIPVHTADRIGAAWHRFVSRLTGGVRGAIAAVGRFIRAQLTPVRLAIAAVILVMAGSAIWTVRSGQIETATRNYERGREDGLRFVEQESFADAAAAFELAAQSADALGLDDAEATAVRIAARELRAATDLSTDSLVTLLGSLQDDEFEDGRWSDINRIRYGDGWHVWEGPVDGRLIRLPIRVGERAVAIDASAAALAPARGSEDTVIFAGRLREAIREGGRIVLRFEPDSVFLWQLLTTYRQLGVPIDYAHDEAGVVRTLRRQAEWNGTPVDPFGDFVDGEGEEAEVGVDGQSDDK